MRTQRSFSPLLALVLLALLATSLYVPASSAQSTEPSGDEFLARVQDRYDALDGLRADFRQIVSSEGIGDSTRIAGRLWLRGNAYRIATDDQTLITDGTTSWVYTPATEQVIVNDVVQDPSVITPQTLFSDYAARYTVIERQTVRRNGASHVRLTLSPSSDAAPFDGVTLWVRASDLLITRLRLTDPGGSIITIDLDDLRVNPSFEPDAFTYTPPDTVEVIDLRS